MNNPIQSKRHVSPESIESEVARKLNGPNCAWVKELSFNFDQKLRGSRGEHLNEQVEAHYAEVQLAISKMPVVPADVLGQLVTAIRGTRLDDTTLRDLTGGWSMALTVRSGADAKMLSSLAGAKNLGESGAEVVLSLRHKDSGDQVRIPDDFKLLLKGEDNKDSLPGFAYGNTITFQGLRENQHYVWQ